MWLPALHKLILQYLPIAREYISIASLYRKHYNINYARLLEYVHVHTKSCWEDTLFTISYIDHTSNIFVINTMS
jgi:hypothetical protein